MCCLDFVVLPICSFLSSISSFFVFLAFGQSSCPLVASGQNSCHKSLAKAVQGASTNAGPCGGSASGLYRIVMQHVSQSLARHGSLLAALVGRVSDAGHPTMSSSSLLRHTAPNPLACVNDLEFHQVRPSHPRPSPSLDAWLRADARAPNPTRLCHGSLAVRRS